MTKNIDDMTENELVEGFFTEHKGWKYKNIRPEDPSDPLMMWVEPEKGQLATPFITDDEHEQPYNLLPDVHKDLNAFEKWVLPEVKSRFDGLVITINVGENFEVCLDYMKDLKLIQVPNGYGYESTLALSLFKAAMKALGGEHE
jgi:hypothetical protein